MKGQIRLSRLFISPHQGFQKATLPPLPVAFQFFFLVAACLALSIDRIVTADEYPITRDSSVVGRNWTVPLPSQVPPDRFPGDLDFLIETAFFAKNLETTGLPTDEVNGETFFGFLLPARFQYQAADSTFVELGALLGQNYGDDQSLDISDPLVRLVHQRGPHYLIAGSLYRTHWIHDALYDDVFAFRDNMETGIQYRAHTAVCSHDCWIDWRIRETPQRSERFEVGSTSQVRFGKFGFDGQLYWSHTGGQLNTEDLVQNNVTGLIGCYCGFGGPIPSAISRGRVAASYLLGSDRDESNSHYGDGVEISWQWYCLSNALNDLKVFAKHYEGDGLQAKRGDPLYQFDRYTQAGANWLHSLAPNIVLEIGFTGQLVDGTFTNSYFLNVYWYDRIRLDWFGRCEPAWLPEQQPGPW